MSLKIDVTRVKKQTVQHDDQLVHLSIVLPDGRIEKSNYRRDLTIGYVKVQLSKSIKVQSHHIELTDESGQTLADPMSLSDYPALVRSGVHRLTVYIDSEHEEHKERDDDDVHRHDEAAALDDEDILDINGHRHR